MRVPPLLTIFAAVQLSAQTNAIRLDRVRQHGAPALQFVQHNDQHPMMLTRNQPTTLQHGIRYVINVTVGTPPQEMQLRLDTGSSYTWFPSSNVSQCKEHPVYCNASGTYNSSLSTTFAGQNDTFNARYPEDDNVSGQLFIDSLNIGSFPPIQALMGLVNHEGSVLDDFPGVLGLSPSPSADRSSTDLQDSGLIDGMVYQGVIATRAYSVWLERPESTSGEIIFGAIDTAKYQGDLAAVPLSPPDQPIENFFGPAINLSAISLRQNDDSDIWTVPISDDLPAVLNIGSTLTWLPHDVFDMIVDKLDFILDLGFALIPCDQKSSQASLSFRFGNDNGPIITVPLADLVLKSPSAIHPNNLLCDFGIQRQSDSYAILGDTFLQSAYIVYNWENQEIALAQSALKPNGSDIINITDLHIPGAMTLHDNGMYTCPAPIKDRPLPSLCADDPSHLPVSNSPSLNRNLDMITAIAIGIAVFFFFTPHLF